MKIIVMVCLAVVITTAASAQKYNRSRYPQPRIRTSIGVGIGSPYYSPYRSPYYSPFYHSYPYRSTQPRPYYSTPVYSRPGRLEMEISELRTDYNDRIWSVRHDKSLSKSERKAEIRRLRSERDRAVRNAEYSYHRRRY
ncbi:MAG TPA: hypothetical protein VFP97_11975 [Chitinophagaceae bacterium]|nr:hypothetical protein [Chitinophagaceae bacterium]